MSKFMLSNALGNLPDDLLQEAMEIKKHTGRKWILRAAACAAVLVLLVAVAFGNSEPFFSVHVHANGTDSVELKGQGSSFFVPAYDSSDAPSKKDDPSYRPELDSYIFDHGPLWNESRVCIGLWLNDDTKNYDQLSIFINGQPIQQDFKGNGFVTFFSKDKEEGRLVYVMVEDATRVDIVLYDDNGKELQHYGMVIIPDEGGWTVTLDKTYVTSFGSRIFANLF